MSDITMTNTTNTTATNSTTLVDLLAVRAGQRAEEERQREAERQRARAEEEQEQENQMFRWALQRLSADLMRALAITVSSGADRLTHPQRNEAELACAAYLRLSVNSGEEEEEEWTITREWRRGWDESWHILRGPGHSAYAVTLDNPQYIDADAQLDDAILDAIAAYPAWLAAADERHAEEQRREREREERKRANTPRRFDATVGYDPRSDRRAGLLTTGNRLRVRVQNSGADADGVIEYDGTLTDRDETWLLIDTASGQQRLIPIARVQDITPLADLPDGDDR